MSQQIDPSPSYRLLAKTGAKIHRVLDGNKMQRFASVCTSVRDFEVRLLFGFEDKQVKVVGTIDGSVALACSRCNLPVVTELSVSLDALVFESEHRLQSWLEQNDNSFNKEVVVSGPSLNLVELVEDELILGLPRATCSECKSDNDDKYVYSSGPKVVTKSPFAGLSDLNSS